PLPRPQFTPRPPPSLLGAPYHPGVLCFNPIAKQFALSLAGSLAAFSSPLFILFKHSRRLIEPKLYR
ncbi:hypothetical protein K432DRAFT_359161, partial [Lepidopterella palustris CBS 459.81]